MPEPFIDEIAPRYIREKRITVALGEDTPLQSGKPVLLTVDYSKCDPEGVVLPLVFEVQGPSSASYQRREFRRASPGSILFKPREGGTHVVTLREAFHNRWWGSVSMKVSGELL